VLRCLAHFRLTDTFYRVKELCFSGTDAPYKIALGLGDVTACSEFDSGQVTCDGHKLDFRLSIRFICKERGLS
jgi:hypothetical protein